MILPRRVIALKEVRAAPAYIKILPLLCTYHVYSGVFSAIVIRIQPC